MWITCAHLLDSDNIIADKESRKAYKEAEWKLLTIHT